MDELGGADVDHLAAPALLLPRLAPGPGRLVSLGPGRSVDGCPWYRAIRSSLPLPARLQRDAAADQVGSFGYWGSALGVHRPEPGAWRCRPSSYVVPLVGCAPDRVPPRLRGDANHPRVHQHRYAAPPPFRRRPRHKPHPRLRRPDGQLRLPLRPGGGHPRGSLAGPGEPDRLLDRRWARGGNVPTPAREAPAWGQPPSLRRAR